MKTVGDLVFLPRHTIRNLCDLLLVDAVEFEMALAPYDLTMGLLADEIATSEDVH